MNIKDFQFKDFDESVHSSSFCQFSIFTDNLKIDVYWQDDVPAEIFCYSKNNTSETFISEYVYASFAVLIGGEWKSIEEIMDWVSDNIDVWVEEELQEIEDYRQYCNDVSSVYWSGRT